MSSLVSDEDEDETEIEEVTLVDEQRVDIENEKSSDEVLAESLSWLDSLSDEDDGVSDDDLSSLVSDEDENESEIEEVTLDDEQPVDIENEKSSDEALAESLSWLDSLSGDDGVFDDDLSSLVSDEDENNQQTNAEFPATIIEELNDETIQAKLNSKAELDQITESFERMDEKLPSTIIEDDDVDSDSDWLKSIEEQDTIVDKNTLNQREIEVDDEELEKLQDTASWKNSLTTDEDYSDEEINSLEDVQKESIIGDKKSPELIEEIESPSSNSWLEELEKQSLLTQTAPTPSESFDSGKEWFEKLDEKEKKHL